MNQDSAPQAPTSSGNHPSPARFRLALGAALALVTLAIYWPVRTHDFVNFDDPDYVSANPMVQAGMTAASVRWAFTRAHSSNWHPVTWLSHMLDCQMFGLNAGAHHLVNAVLHAANVALLFLLLVRLTGVTGRSALIAALFALHPLHVESVAWISERKDVLSACFGLLTLLAYARHARKCESRNSRLETTRKHQARRAGAWAAYGVALICYALGLMAKPMLVTWPFVMLLLDVWPLKRINFPAGGIRPSFAGGRVLVEKLPFFVLAIASCVVTVMVQRSSGATVPLDTLPLSTRLAQASVSYLRYLGKTFWPENLAAFYPYAPADWENPLALAGVVVVSGVSIWAVRELRRRPAFAVGWFWFLGTLVPVIGLVQVGRQSIADRYTYLAHIGLFVALVWLAAELLERLRLPRPVRVATSLAVLTACATVTSRQVGHWHNTHALARHAIEVTTGNFVAHAQIASALVLEGRLDEAERECREALRIKPDYAEAHQTLGSIRVRQGKSEDALASFREAARCDKTFPDPHHGMADIYFKLGKLSEAEQASREAVRLWPMHLGALYILASALHDQGKLDEAIATYRKLITFKPGLFSAHRGLGGALATQGDLPAAALEFRRALEIQPENADAHNSLGLVLLSQGNAMTASNHFSRALTVQPTNAIAHYQIALLLIAAQKPAQAVEHYRATLRARPDLPDVLNNLAWLFAASSDATVRNGSEAVRLAERACEITASKEPVIVGTLAAAYAEAGRFPEAVAAAEKAIGLAEAAGLNDIAKRNRELLELYRAGKAFHEAP